MSFPSPIDAKSFHRWHLIVAGLLLSLIGFPIFLSCEDVLTSFNGWHAWREGDRIARLALNTCLLAGGTILLAVPTSTAVAVLLYRSDLPGARLLRCVNVLLLFIPLPLVTSAWQAALGDYGWMTTAGWNSDDLARTWKPWAEGLKPAIWIHAMAATPWAVLIVGHGLNWIERELEEEGLLAATPWTVLRYVTFPRCKAIIGIAALWIGLQTATEITVSDTMQFRTFAEEIYTQLVVGGPSAQARSVAVAAPFIVSIWLIVLLTTQFMDRKLPALERSSDSPLQFTLGWARWPLLVLFSMIAGAFVAIPLISLIWKAGVSGTPPTWSAAEAWTNVARTFYSRQQILVESLGVACFAGCTVAALGLFVCWLSISSSIFRTVSIVLVAITWSLPGPLAGFGLKEAIKCIIPISPLLADALYNGPSLLPAAWADVLRFFPYGVILLWPVVRIVPMELRETAVVDGLGPFNELRFAILPSSISALIQTAFVTGILALGELSASKLVETPGAQTLTHEIFVEMHYGVTANVAALCLVLMATISVIATGSFAANLLLRRIWGCRSGHGS